MLPNCYSNSWIICTVTLLFNILPINWSQWNILYENNDNFQLSFANHIANVPILDNMYTFFDIYISSRPTNGPNNLLQIGDTDAYNTSFDRRPTIYITQSGSIIFRLKDVNNTDNAIDGPVLDLSMWYNVTIMYTQSLWQCYINNVLIGGVNNIKRHNTFSSKKVWASGAFIGTSGAYTINANISNLLIRGYPLGPDYIVIEQCLHNGHDMDGGWYDATSIDIQNNIWTDKFGNNNHAQIINTTGLIYLANYLNGESIIEGTTSTQIVFGTFNPRNHTVFNVAKYAPNASTKGRIIMTNIENGLFGFHQNGESGVAYEGPGGYNQASWITNEENKFNDLWVISSQQRSLYRGNLIDFTENSNPIGFSKSDIKLSINTGGDSSDFQLAELIYFNTILDITEIECIEYYLNDKYGFDYTPIPTLNPTMPTSNPTKSPTYEILSETNACFDAQKSNESTIFNAPFDGELIGIKLIYITGGVTCGNNNQTLVKWGCIGDGFYLNFIHVANGAYYPKNGNTKGFSLPSNYPSPYYNQCDVNTCGHHSYLLNNQSENDTEMVWLGPSYQITITDQFMLQYSDACCAYGNDNIGSTCTKVYFLYNEYKTINPSNNPTINPTHVPSKIPTIGPISANANQGKKGKKVNILWYFVVFCGILQILCGSVQG